MTIETPLRVLILRDARPGHRNLSEGIARALAATRPLDLQRVDVRRGRWPGALLAAWSNSAIEPKRLLSTVYGLTADTLGRPDLIVSAGAETLAANVAASRLTGAANIFYGSLRRFAPADFALVLTSYPERANWPRHAFLMKPAPWPPDQFAPPSPPHGPPRSIGLLVGGDAGTFRWGERDAAALVDLIEGTWRTSGIIWRATNSRRTPPALSDRLAALVAADGHGPLREFTDVRAAGGGGSLVGLLQASDALVVTADSSSMVSEAAQTFRPVVAVTPQDFSWPREEATYRDWLAATGAVETLALRDVSPQALLDAVARTRPLQASPAHQLVALIAARVPQLGLSPPLR